MENAEKYVRQLIKEELDRMFFTEERHVSMEVDDATKYVIQRLVEEEKNIKEGDWMPMKPRTGEDVSALKSEEFFSIKSNDLFFEKIHFNVQFVKILSSNKDVDIDELILNSNRGYVYLDRIILDENKVKEATIKLRLCYIDNVDNNYTHAVVDHELKHLFELLKRRQLKFSKRDNLNNQIHNSTKEENKLKKLTFLFYCLCKSEISASIQSVYGELYSSNSVDKDRFLQLFYKTNVYKNFFKHLKEPENYLKKEFIETITVGDLEKLNEKILATLEDFELEDTEKEYEIYFKPTDTIDGYLQRLFKFCKQAYDKLFRNVGSVISLVIDNKNKSFIGEMKIKMKNLYSTPYPFENDWEDEWISQGEILV